MLDKLMLEIFNRKPATEILNRHNEEGKDFVCADGRIEKIIGLRM